MKPFYIHINFNKPGKMPNKHPRAATVLVQAAPNGADAHVQVALCSPKDEFCKREGRSYADKAEIESCRIRDLPHILSSIADFTGHPGKDYNYVLRNFF